MKKKEEEGEEKEIKDTEDPCRRSNSQPTGGPEREDRERRGKYY